ncbi:unnamed protein product [Ilex paraguariensis]|uniref:Anaphase-promoting complex subunit 1 C-terminal domain-containing protein n=1 Tax=Ilex paraguariensis TaxID=185542 RepID=A0ABC8U3B0_9AQUA
MVVLIIFHQHVCRSDIDFQEFCLQVLLECVSKDRPALLQVYLSLYTTIGYMADEITSDISFLGDSLFLSSLKLALAYNEALLNGRILTSRGSIVLAIFLGSLRKRVEEILNCFAGLENHFSNYLKSGRWPSEISDEGKPSTLLSWYLQWYSIPTPTVIKTALEKIKPIRTTTSVPLLRLLLPGTHISAIDEINKLFLSSEVNG